MSGLVMLSVRPIVSDPATNDAMNINQENQTIPLHYGLAGQADGLPVSCPAGLLSRSLV